jgi:hypothetical protein
VIRVSGEVKRLPGERSHPRYRCADHVEYIAGYALPPYLNEREPNRRQR